MLAVGFLAPDLRRRRASPPSDNNARAVHADMCPPGSRTPSDHPPEHHFLQIPVAERIAQVPPDTQQNDVSLEMAPFERVLMTHEGNSFATLQIKKRLPLHFHSCNTTRHTGCVSSFLDNPCFSPLQGDTFLSFFTMILYLLSTMYSTLLACYYLVAHIVGDLTDKREISYITFRYLRK
jgi:hypothetical protein